MDKIEISFDYVGVSWRVELVVYDKCVDSVLSVSAFDGKSYVELDVDTGIFQKEMEDVLDEEVQDYYFNLELAHADMMYETAREEGKIQWK